MKFYEDINLNSCFAFVNENPQTISIYDIDKQIIKDQFKTGYNYLALCIDHYSNTQNKSDLILVSFYNCPGLTVYSSSLSYGLLLKINHNEPDMVIFTAFKHIHHSKGYIVSSLARAKKGMNIWSLNSEKSKHIPFNAMNVLLLSIWFNEKEK